MNRNEENREGREKEDQAQRRACDFPGDSDGKESACNAEDLGSVPGLGRFPWRRAWQPTPLFLPENPMDRGASGATVHRVTKSWT